MKFGNKNRYGMKKGNIPNLMRTNYGIGEAPGKMRSPVKDSGHGGDPGHDHDENIDWEDKPVVKKSSVLDPKSGTSTHITETTLRGTSSTHKPKRTHDEGYKIWLKDNPGGSRSEYMKKAEEHIASKTKKHTRGGKTQTCSCPNPDGGDPIKYTATDGKTCAEAKPAACTKKPEKKKCE